MDEFAKPSIETLSTVNSFLESHGLSSTALTRAGEWINVAIPVSLANELFDADFQTFTHIVSGKQAIRSLSFSLPESLMGSIEAALFTAQNY